MRAMRLRQFPDAFDVVLAGSADEGESWGSVARYLPDILSLRAARLP